MPIAPAFGNISELLHRRLPKRLELALEVRCHVLVQRKEVTDPDAESGFEWTVLLGIPLLPLLGKKRWINPDALDLSRT